MDEYIGIQFTGADVHFYNDIDLGYDIYQVISIGDYYDYNSDTDYAITFTRFDYSFLEIDHGYFLFSSEDSYACAKIAIYN